MTVKTKYIRKGKTIYTLEYTAAEDGTEVVNRVAATYKSINAAKRESRKLQGSNPGNGLLRVEHTKRRTRIEGNRLTVR